MNRHKISFTVLAFAMIVLLLSCSNNPSRTITSIEIEVPAGDEQLTENGYALFSGKKYSSSKDFSTRGYINNGSSYSYVKAKVYAQDIFEENALRVEIGDDFRFSTGTIYNVWAEYNGMKSNTVQVCSYEANTVFSSTLDVDAFDKELEYSEIIKKVGKSMYFTESGALKYSFGPDVPNLTFCFIDSETGNIKELKSGSDESIGNTSYDFLYVYSDPTTPFNIVKEIKVYDKSRDFDAIALNTAHIDRANCSLKGLLYAKRLNGLTVQNNLSPFEEDTTRLKYNHTITISLDGDKLKTYSSGELVDFKFETGKKYTITLTVKVGVKEYSKSKTVSFSKK